MTHLGGWDGADSRSAGAGRWAPGAPHDSMTKWRITAAMGSRHTGQLKPALCRPRLE